jgi:hypothetical protein
VLRAATLRRPIAWRLPSTAETLRAKGGREAAAERKAGMASTLQTFFSAQAQLLAQGRISALARAYATPLPVYLLAPGSWHVLHTRSAIVETFWAKHEGVRSAGVGRLRACVTEEHWVTPGRCQAEVTWFYVGDGGRRLGRTVAGYYLTRRPEGLAIDLLEFRRIAFPQLRGWFTESAVELRPGVRPAR